MRHRSLTLLMAAFLPLLAVSLAAQPAAASTLRRLTNVINSYPMPSPDGARVVFQSNRSGRWEVYRMEADGSGLVRLTDEPGDNVTPVWSPDGTRLAFAASSEGQSDIFVMNADGSGGRRLTDHPGDDSHPHWSADGERIIFNSARTTPDLGAAWGQQWHEIFSLRLRIAFASNRAGPASVGQIFLVKADGSGLVQVTRGPWSYAQPAWSADGQTVYAYQNEETPTYEFGDVVAIDMGPADWP